MTPVSIRVRLTAWYSLALALSLCLFGAAAYFAMSTSIRTTLDAGLQQQLEGIRNIIVKEASHGPAALEDELQELAYAQGARGKLRVTDQRGRTAYASPGMEAIRQSPETTETFSTFNRKIGGDKFRVLTGSVEVAGTRYDVAVAASTKEFDQALERFRHVLFFTVPAFLALAALGGYWMSRRALAPVDEITKTARNIGAQDLAQRLAVPQTGDELARLAETLNAMLARLEAAFRRVTQFTADASHELRTPVSVMRTSAELALRKPRSEEEYRQALSQILQEADNVSGLIEQLLMLARADSASAALPLSRTDLAASVRKACSQARVLAEAKQLVEIESLPDEPLWVRGDPASLERLFLILLDNAVKYTPSGGRIEIHLGADDGFAIAEVRDTGIGIAAEDIPHVFDRFYRADRARSRESGGSGLGLAIGRWIVDAHSGEIRVQSEPFKGSSFQVRLPLAHD